MPTQRTAARSAKPSLPLAAPEDIATSLLPVLGAIEGLSDSSPAAGAYRAALRRKGEALAQAGGTAALLDALARVRAADPARADARETALAVAWAGIPGWASRHGAAA